MDIEKEHMTLKPFHSSTIKIKDRGVTESSIFTKAEKEFIKEIASECRPLKTNKKIFERREEVSIFKNSPKEREKKTSDWSLGLCKKNFPYV